MGSESSSYTTGLDPEMRLIIAPILLHQYVELQSMHEQIFQGRSISREILPISGKGFQ